MDKRFQQTERQTYRQKLPADRKTDRRTDVLIWRMMIKN